MAALLEFLPILAFFVALKLGDVMVATGVAIAATLAVTVHQRVTTGRVAPMTLLSAGLMVVFGGLTLALDDERFVKLKPTILFGLFALGLLVSRFFGPRTIAERLLGALFEAPAAAWRRVNDGLTLHMAALAGLNLWVAATFDTETWATFKLIGLLVLNFLGLFGAVAYLSRHGQRKAPPAT
jgi:intracellular septation protein